MKKTEVFDRIVNRDIRAEYHLIEDDVEPALRALSDLELQGVFDELEMRLGCEFAHLLSSPTAQPFISEGTPYCQNGQNATPIVVFGSDMIVLEACCEGGENHTTAIETLFDLHQRTDEMLRDRGLDPYDD